MKNNCLIKCGVCGTMVTLKGQYMLMCPSCGRKMPNSFPEYEKVTPGATFDQYLAKHSISASAAEGLMQQRKLGRQIKKRKNLLRFLAALMVAIVIAICGVVGYRFVSVSDSYVVESTLSAKWRLNYYEDLGVTINFPHVLEAQIDTTFAVVDTATNIKHIVARSWTKKQVCAVTSIMVDYENTTSDDRQRSTDIILGMLVNDNQMQALQYTPSDYMLGDAKARMLSGSYLIETRMHEFRAVMVTRDQSVWYFMVSYLESTPEGTLLAEKFFRSIQIN